MSRRRSPSLTAAASLAGPLAAMALSVTSAGATVADDLCGPLDDPCVVSTSVTVDAGSVLDFGARTFRISSTGSLTWGANVRIQAGRCEFEEKSKIYEARDSTADDFLWLECDSSEIAGKIKTRGSGLQLEGDGPHVVSGQVLAQGDAVKPIAIDSYGMPGHITVTGKYNVKSKTGTPPGEFRLTSNFGNIEIAESARLKVQGAMADPFGEIFWVEAGTGTLTIDGQIDLKQKTGAYAVNLEANGNVSFGAKSKIKAGAKVTGPEIAINSQSGSVHVYGKIQAPTKDADLGDGTKLNFCASGDIRIHDKALLDGSSGSSGQVILGAGGLARIGDLGGYGAKVFSKSDGDIEICGGLGGQVTSASIVIPDPEASGFTGECLSPESGVIFFLDCNQ